MRHAPLLFPVGCAEWLALAEEGKERSSEEDIAMNPRRSRSACRHVWSEAGLWVLASVLFACLPGLALGASGSWGELSPEAQGAISGVLGRELAAYHARPAGGGVEAANAAHGLAVEFGATEVRVRAGRDEWRLALAGYGRGEPSREIAPVQPHVAANRVE